MTSSVGRMSLAARPVLTAMDARGRAARKAYDIRFDYLTVPQRWNHVASYTSFVGAGCGDSVVDVLCRYDR